MITIEDIIQFKNDFNKVNTNKPDTFISYTRGKLDSLLILLNSQKSKLMIYQRLADFTEKGWPTSRIVGQFPSIHLYSLSQILDEQDSVVEVTEEYIKIKKNSGAIQYYEKDTSKSKDRPG